MWSRILRQGADVVLVAITGLGLTLLVSELFQRVEDARLEQVFLRDAVDLAGSIEQTIAINMRDLDALQAILGETSPRTPDRFQRLARPFLDNALALAWMVPVDAGYRPVLEQELTGAHGREIAIVDAGEDQTLEPSSARPLYFPLVHIASGILPNPPLGLDMMNEPRRRDALRRAIESRDVAATEPLPLVTGEEEHRLGLSLLKPVFDGDAMDMDSGFAIRGLVMSAIDFPGLLGERELAETELAVALVHQPGHDDPLTVMEAGRPVGDSLLLREAIRIADQNYLLEIRPGAGYAETRSRAVWLQVATGGMLITVILVAYVISMKVQRRRALALVEERTRELRVRESQLRQMAITDELTGLFNRRYLEDAVARESSRLQRYGTPAALIMFDLDHFKSINDGFGHEVGDRVLAQVAGLLGGRTRETDVCARWGGEEFMILCAGTDGAQANRLAELLREAIARAGYAVPTPVTASFGVTSLRTDDTLESLLRRVDKLLYRAKDEGRNRVVTDCA